ncbi:hypothetical protein ACEN2J_03050 [Pseudorhodobacter sp. W20_MBD10_FR17]|uniref:hypothetical protein n=1 Tax=Pseudorhodobacter sp. W20_MBD10_FR17 TaxID=3240266 RepID=UPI003F9E9257
MLNKEKHKTKPRKDSQLIIRISGAERDQFVSLCETMDTSAAREVRRFIRGFLMQHDAPSEPANQPKKEPYHGEES